MQTDRSASFASKDVITSKIKSKRLARKEQQAERSKRKIEKIKDSFMYESVNPEIELNQDPFTQPEQNTSVKRRHRRAVKTSCNISIPHGILTLSCPDKKKWR